MSPVVRSVCRVGWCIAALLVVALPGCSGCTWFNSTAQSTLEEDKTKPKPKPDFELTGGTLLPYNFTTLQTGYKPGHWTTATVDGVANNFDASQGQIVTDPVDAIDMPYTIAAAQSISLPKGQKRRRELSFFVPSRYDDLRTTGLPRKQVPILFRLQPNDGWRTTSSDLLRVRPLENYQYYLVVMSGNTEPQHYWEKLPSIDCHADMAESEELDRGKTYFVIVPPIASQAPLPTTPMSWTSISHLVWDGLSPELLNEPQQRSMLDWLHWGGQLIISGPESLAALRKTPLGDYLPADAAATHEFTPGDLAEFRREWWPRRDLPLVKEPWSGVSLTPKPTAAVLVEAGGLPLVVERSVGRGRIVVTAFRLTEPEYVETVARDDSFVNALLLRRPAREYFRRPETEDLAYRWSETQGWPSTDLLSPALASSVAFFSRDAEARKFLPEWISGAARDFRQLNADESERALMFQYSAYDSPRSTEPEPAPIGAWDDFSGASTEARSLLIHASGIKVPDRSFVVLVMGVYLIILVPVNWLIFKSIGKVEWAWAAAPVITICYALAVVKLAEVNVGFSRPRNDVAIVELQSGYPRAHLTRYTSLYASLFTSYDLKFDDPSAVVQPLADGRRPATWQNQAELIYRRDGDAVSMADFEVASNSLSMLHSEQMFDVGGTIDLDVARTDGGPHGNAPVYRVTNNSRRTLHAVQVFGPPNPVANALVRIRIALPDEDPALKKLPLREGEKDVAPAIYFDLGDLEPGQSKLLEADQARNARDLIPREKAAVAVGESTTEATRPASATETTTAVVEADEVNRGSLEEKPVGAFFDREKLTKLWNVARRTRPEDEWRLIGWSDEVLPGMEATPAPQVHREANLFVVHLSDMLRPVPKPDTNPRSAVPVPDPISLEAPTEDPNSPNTGRAPGALVPPIPPPAP